MFKITTFSGNQRNVTNGQIESFDTFRDLAKMFETPQGGIKHNGYFVRGVLDPIHRLDENLHESNLLVLDADKGADGGNAPSPLKMHNTLKQLALEHFIYTSHSHNLTQNKYRVVIPCELKNKEQLKLTIGQICNTLDSLGSGIENVREMSVWTQPWFVPTRDDPNDGLFEFYYGEGKWLNAIKGSVNTSALVASDSSGNIKSMEQMIREIQDGYEYHTNIRNIVWGLVKDGVAPKSILATMQGILHACKVKDERWQTRYDELWVNIEGAAKKNVKVDEPIEDVDLSDINLDEQQISAQLPWPPGRLGELANCSYDQQIYQYKEVALVSAVGLVAGIVGRKFNVDGAKPMGLNVYMTLIMSTGMGKEGIGDFIERHILSSKELSSGMSFYGNGDFTSGKAIVSQFKDARSQVCVVSEAGLLLQTKSGNVASKTAMLLDMYSKSHRDGYTKGTTFSSTEDTVPRLRAVAATLISEATPETLLQAYMDAGSLDNGHLPRQSIFRVFGKRPPMNRRTAKESPEHIRAKIRHLITKCSAVQAAEDPNPHMMEFTPEMWAEACDYSDQCNEILDKFIHENPVKAKMATRMFVKAIKYAAIATVFNYDEQLIIGRPEWEWAKRMVEYEMDTVSSFFIGGGYTDRMRDACMRIVAPSICRLLKQRRTLEGKNSFTRYEITQNLKNNKEVHALSDDPKFKSSPRSGADKILEYMITMELIRPAELGKAKGYIILPLFKTAMKERLDT